MQVNVAGKHLDIGEALQEYVEAEITGAVSKYFEHAINADVVFTKQRHFFRADVYVNEGTGSASGMIKANAEDDDIYAAFDAVTKKIEKQLRRYKDKLKAHHTERLGKDFIHDAFEVKQYILSGESDDEVSVEEEAPLIIAEKQMHIEEITVSDAVMRMDLGDLSSLMFINRGTGTVSMIHRREDGNIVWVDSGLKAEKKSSEAA